MNGRLILVMALGVLAFSAFADGLRFPAWFSDHMVLQRGKAIPVWGWAKAGAKVTVKLGDEIQTGEADQNGRWSVSFSPRPAGGPFVLSAEGGSKIEITDVLIGDVWVIGGQSNMNIPVKEGTEAEEAIRTSEDHLLRIIRISERPAYMPQEDVAGKWAVSSRESVEMFSCVGYAFGKKLREELKDVPVGLIQAAVGSSSAETWLSRTDLEQNPNFAYYSKNLDEIADKFPELKTDAARAGLKWLRIRKDKIVANQKFLAGEIKERPSFPDVPHTREIPALMYNGMIHPLTPFSIRGVIWWQGLSNSKPVERAYEYRKLFPYLIQCWRQAWRQDDLPFIFAEEPTLKWDFLKPGFMLIREAQLMAFREVSNTAVIVTSDLRNDADPELKHFPQKPPVGRRMAAAALTIEYKKPAAYTGPLFDPQKTRIEGNKIRIGFTHIGSGLAARNGKLADFVIAGEDRNFVEAQAEIDDNTVVVRADSICAPKAVRYDWTDWTGATLMNKEGLPASPFRTDDWPLSDK
jgi:sialate O-acetylesterase